MLCLCSPQSIIRDYGQRRLREIEAHRQLVKPLKQLGTPNMRILNMRSVSASLSAISASDSAGGGGGGSSGGGGGGGGGSPTGTYTQARPGAGGRMYTYCYTNDDPESHVQGFAGTDKSFFLSVCSNVRRLFHRKMRRQKGSEDGDAAAGGLATDSAKTEGKPAWGSEEQRYNDSDYGSGGGGGKMVKLCCSTGSSDSRAKWDDYIAVQAPALDSAGDQIPNRPTRGFHSYPSGYTAVLTEEEESNGRYLTTQHNHRLPDVSEQSVGSADNLQTVVEVNSNSAAQQPRPRLLAAWTTTTAPPEIQFTDDQGDVIYPCADSGDSDADSDAASVECAVGELNDDKSDDTGGRGGAGGKGRPSSDRRRSEPATRNRQSPRGRRLSESSARSPHGPSANVGDRTPSGDPEVFHRHAQGPRIFVDRAFAVDSGDSQEQAGMSQPSTHPVDFLHPDYCPQSLTTHLDESGPDVDAHCTVRRCRSNSAPSIVAHALPGSSVHLPPPCAAVRLSPGESSVAVGATAVSPSAKRVSLFQRYCVLHLSLFLRVLSVYVCLCVSLKCLRRDYLLLFDAVGSIPRQAYYVLRFL